MKRQLLYFVAVLITASCVNCHSQQEEEETPALSTVTLSQEQTAKLNITTAPLGEYCFAGAVKASGRLAVSPQGMAAITARVGASIESIVVQEGQRVSKGQVVAYLSSPDVTEMQSRYASALSRREYLRKEYERQRQMMDEQVGAGKDYDRAKSDYQDACNEVSMLAAQLQQVGVSAAAVSSGKAAGRIAVCSPIEGTVENITVQTGQYAAPETLLMNVVNTDNIYADLLVYQRDVGKVCVGQDVRLQSDGKTYHGKVSSVANTFASDVQAVHVRVGIDDGSRGLISGMYVDGKIATDSTRVPAVSDEAIVDEAGKSYVFSVSRQGRQWLFTPVEVRRGEEEDGMVMITPVDASSNLSCIAQTGAYYILSEMKKGETGEE